MACCPLIVMLKFVSGKDASGKTSASGLWTRSTSCPLATNRQLLMAPPRGTRTISLFSSPNVTFDPPAAGLGDAKGIPYDFSAGVVSDVLMLAGVDAGGSGGA